MKDTYTGNESIKLGFLVPVTLSRAHLIAYRTDAIFFFSVRKHEVGVERETRASLGKARKNISAFPKSCLFGAPR